MRSPREGTSHWKCFFCFVFFALLCVAIRLCSLACHHAGRSWQPLSVCLFTIDDTGCPTSQSVSPSKTPSGSEQSARGSPTLPERVKTKVKRVRVMTEWSGEARSSQRHKRELRSAMKARGKLLLKKGRCRVGTKMAYFLTSYFNNSDFMASQWFSILQYLATVDLKWRYDILSHKNLVLKK